MGCETALLIGQVLIGVAVLCFITLFATVVWRFRSPSRPGPAVMARLGLRGLIGRWGFASLIGFCVCTACVLVLATLYGEELDAQGQHVGGTVFRLSTEHCQSQL